MRRRYVYAPSEMGGHLVAEYKGSECVYYDAQYYDAQDAGYMVLPDIQPYKSMIDGSLITSRSVHRSHLKQHGCVEVGNDSSLIKRPQPMKSPPGLKEEIVRATNAMIERNRR